MPSKVADNLEPGLPERLLAQNGYLSDTLKRAVLDQWGLDVWCPSCGALGQRFVYGMLPRDEYETFDEHGDLKPWPSGGFADRGCVVSGVDPSYRCQRRTYVWGGDLGRARRARHMEGLADPLRATHCDGLSALEAELAEYGGCTVRIGLDNQQSPDGFALEVADRSLELTFPIELPELWDLLEAFPRDDGHERPHRPWLARALPSQRLPYRQSPRSTPARPQMQTR